MSRLATRVTTTLTALIIALAPGSAGAVALPLGTGDSIRFAQAVLQYGIQENLTDFASYLILMGVLSLAAALFSGKLKLFK